MINIFHNEDFIFRDPFNFRDRFHEGDEFLRYNKHVTDRSGRPIRFPTSIGSRSTTSR